MTRLRTSYEAARIQEDSLPSQYDAERDIQSLLWSADLAQLRRFHNQPFWEREGEASDRARYVEGPIRLESVADHSWKVADAVLTLADHFAWVDRCRALELAILHDKLEIVTGDLSPIDEEATGRSTHAFNDERALEKRNAELVALRRYETKLRPEVGREHAALLHELIFEQSDEARFVKAVDKFASLVFVIQAKRGALDPKHVEFTLAYTGKAVVHFPALRRHYEVLVDLFLRDVRANNTE